MPAEIRMVLMSDEEYDAFSNMTQFLRMTSAAMPELRTEVYDMANKFQEILNRMWGFGFRIEPTELVYEELD